MVTAQPQKTQMFLTLLLSVKKHLHMLTLNWHRIKCVPRFNQKLQKLHQHHPLPHPPTIPSVLCVCVFCQTNSMWGNPSGRYHTNETLSFSPRCSVWLVCHFIVETLTHKEGRGSLGLLLNKRASQQGAGNMKTTTADRGVKVEMARMEGGLIMCVILRNSERHNKRCTEQ